MTIDAPPTDKKVSPATLEMRARIARDEQKRRDMLDRHRERASQRYGDGNWPVDARTGERADLDSDDVLAPLEEWMLTGFSDEQIAATRAAAEATEPKAKDLRPGQVDVDPVLQAHRQAEHERRISARKAVVGERWTEELVEARIDEAFRVLSRVSVGGFGPRAFGNGMPPVVREFSDYAAQAGNRSLRKTMKRLLRDDGPPSDKELARMNDALQWGMRYLRHLDPDYAMFLNLGGMWRAWRAPVSRKCAEIGVKRQVFYRDRKEAVRIVMEGLIREGRAPT